MINLTFTKGGQTFTAAFDAESCSITDETLDPRFNLRYGAKVTDIHVNLKRKYIKVEVEFGVVSPTGELMNVQTQEWTFREGDPDYTFFKDTYGLSFMGSSVNGFVKHFMKKHPRYAELTSQFLRVIDDQGNYLEANND